MTAPTRLLAALLLCLLGACGPAPPPVQPPSAARSGATPSEATPSDLAEPAPESSFESYVALGDSFTAGPYVPVTDLASGCFRSDGNYPSLVAGRLGIEDFTDVSCSGAATGHLFAPQHPIEDVSVPPQLDALDEDTDLVTVGIGGNDFDLFSTLVMRCTQLRAVDPDAAPCTDTLAAEGVDLVGLTDRIGDRVARALQEVRDRAPEATVLVVGYLRLVPPDGGCPEAGLADGDYGMAHAVTRSLNQALDRASRDAGVGFVDMFAASRGHDICADRPWVQGSRTNQQAAFAYHPLAAGMEAVADRLVARLD